MKIHKKADTLCFWDTTYCGHSNLWSKLKIVVRWNKVTCKNCLKHKK